jgi:hypothetical protein
LSPLLKLFFAVFEVSKQWHGSDKGAELINFVLVLFQGERERASERTPTRSKDEAKTFTE